MRLVPRPRTPLQWAGLVLLIAGLFAALAAADFSHPPPPRPLVLWHGAGAELHPHNSSAAVLGALAADPRPDGIEVDVGVTADGVAVLAHDPELPERCGPARPLLRDLTTAQVAAVCSPGLPRLADALRSVASAPGFVIFLDLKIHPQRSVSPAAFADAIVPLLRDHPGPVWIEVPDDAAAAAFADVGSATRVLSWPPFRAGGSSMKVGALTAVATLLQFKSPAQAANRAGTDGVVMPSQGTFRTVVDRARDRGAQVVLFGMPEDTPRCDQADLLIVDYSGQRCE